MKWDLLEVRLVDSKSILLALWVAGSAAIGVSAGASCKIVKTCTVQGLQTDGGQDALVPWWGDAATCDASDCLPTNECGGFGVLAILPGEPCGNCGGAYVCDGPDSVRCADPCMDVFGCADGEREAFTDATAFPDIAGCSGGWSEKGILNRSPLCSRLSGDDSDNPQGLGCSAADLCAEGWHICDSPEEVSASSPSGCNGDIPPNTFFAAAVSGDGGDSCDPGGTNDLFGCGTIGRGADANCAPLNRASGDQCDDLTGEWDCPGSWLFGSDSEAEDVRKNGPGGGGVLCCRLQGGP